ncbi:MAG: ATP-binding cassette domain-containing protein [Elusimicrobia bacterium]|nr:ATP-binding cassette domain-containing protein [Elusimicrobiota bacterium]
MLSIRVDDLRKTIAGRPALDGLSAAFAPGTLHGLIGPDGAGKTTFLRLLAGLLRPSAGRIDYLRDGRPVPFDDVRPRLAYMPQTQSLYADLSVGEHLEFFRDLHARAGGVLPSAARPSAGFDAPGPFCGSARGSVVRRDVQKTGAHVRPDRFARGVAPR